MGSVAMRLYSSATPFLFDDTTILEMRELRTLSWRTVSGTTRPLVQLSLALNWLAGGKNVVGYHLVNVGVHALAFSQPASHEQATSACAPSGAQATVVATFASSRAPITRTARIGTPSSGFGCAAA